MTVREGCDTDAEACCSVPTRSPMDRRTSWPPCCSSAFEERLGWKSGRATPILQGLLRRGGLEGPLEPIVEFDAGDNPIQIDFEYFTTRQARSYCAAFQSA